MFTKGTTMFASKGFKATALLATLIMAFSLVAVDTAEARRGGSFGGRGQFKPMLRRSSHFRVVLSEKPAKKAK